MHSVIRSHSAGLGLLEGRKQGAVGAEGDRGREEARNQSGEGRRGARKPRLRRPQHVPSR